MKHPIKLKIISAVLMTVCVTVGSLIAFDQPMQLSHEKAHEKTPGYDIVTESSTTSDIPLGNYTPTKWDPVASPDMYQIQGTAILPDNKPAPGEVIYEYDRGARRQSVSALLTRDNMLYGDRERESLSNINPIGWPRNENTTITFPDGTTYKGWFWNRSHLLGHALGGEDEEKNLITGTRAQNVGKNDMHGGMQFAESLAHDYLENHPSGQVYYIVTPVYMDNENIPRSVFIDIQSDDLSIDYHLEVYNAMPGYDINYITGEIHTK